MKSEKRKRGRECRVVVKQRERREIEERREERERERERGGRKREPIKFNLNQPSFMNIERISDTSRHKLDTCT